MAVIEAAAPRETVDAPAPKRRRGPDRAVIALVAIIVVGAAVRIIGSRFGFPLLVHPDESAITDPVVDMARRHSFEPSTYLRPDHLEMKLDYFTFRLYAFFDGHSVPSAYRDNPVPFFWLARLLTVAFGIVSVVLGYLIGARRNRSVGLIAAALVALYPLYVRDGHYATPDVPLTCTTMLAVYAMMRYWDAPRRQPLLLACLGLALSVTLKYPGAAIAGMIGLIVVAKAVRDRTWQRGVWHLVLGAVASLVFTFLISPSLFTNFHEVRRELSVQSAGNRLGHPDYGLFGNMRFYAETFAHYSGVLVIAVAVVGVVVAVRERWGACLPWLVSLLFWVSLARLPLTWERWGLPMFIAPLLFAALGLDAVFRRFREGRLRAVPIAVAAIIGLYLATSTLGVVTSLTETDTRLASRDWARQHDITAAETAFDGYTPFSPGTPALLGKRATPDGNGGFRFRTKAGAPARYVIVSAGMYSRVFTDKSYADQRPVYTWLFENAREIKRFAAAKGAVATVWEPLSIARNIDAISDAASGGLTGPVIRIFELPAAT